MALITCPECQAQVSDKAAACPKCGAPIAGPMANAMPVVAVKPPRTIWWYWWLWGPVALFLAFILFGALIPKNVADANAFARACREIARGNAAAQLECDRQEARIRYSPPAGVAPGVVLTPEASARASQQDEAALEAGRQKAEEAARAAKSKGDRSQGVFNPYRQ